MNSLEQLKTFSTVVADTADFLQIAKFAPRDATTNPSLVLKAARQERHAPLLREVAAHTRMLSLADAADALLVRFGLEILQVVPGRVSTEIDACHSFDTAATADRAQRIVAHYEAAGIGRARVLIKIAATWEGIRAAEQLERQGIHCNLTLLFSMTQALACADAGVQLISPFVGRVCDWHRRQAGPDWDEAAHAGSRDPGVGLVRRIHERYKLEGIRTEVMAASFRNIAQVLALAGCDLLTVGPDLLEQLHRGEEPVSRMLHAPGQGAPARDRTTCDEAAFRFELNEDAIATEKLAEGIRVFVADARRLQQLLGELRAQAG